MGRSLLTRESPSSRARRRRLLLGVAVVLALASLTADLLQPPAEQHTTRLALLGIELYQHSLSPILARAGVRCRFRPTCSVYGAQVVRHDGLLLGGGRALWRILRCGPWTPAGTYEPPWWETADEERSREATR